MKPKTLLLLSLVTLALAAFILFYEKDLPSTDQKAEREKKVLILDKEDLQSLTLAQGQNRIELVKQKADPAPEDATSAGWRLTAPVDAEADSTAVEALIDQLLELPKTRDLTQADAESLGLSQPEVELELATEKGSWKLQVGAELPLSADRAVGLTANGESSIVQAKLGADLLQTLGQKADAWRDRRLFRGARNAIESLVLEYQDRQVRLTRMAGGEEYRLTAPVTDQADGERVRELLTTLTGLEAKEFLPADAGLDRGLDPPQGILRVEFSDSSAPWLLELGYGPTTEPEVLWLRAGEVDSERETFAVADSGLAEIIEREAQAWRSRVWTSFQVFSLQNAQFRGAGEDFAIERKEGDWHRDGEPIEYTAVSEALYPLTETRAQELLSPATAEDRFDLNDPRLTIILGNDDREEVLSVYPSREGLAALQRQGRDTVLVIDSQQADQLVARVEELRNAPIMDTAGAL